jgi:hypothetical protein
VVAAVTNSMSLVDRMTVEIPRPIAPLCGAARPARRHRRGLLHELHDGQLYRLFIYDVHVLCPLVGAFDEVMVTSEPAPAFRRPRPRVHAKDGRRPVAIP